MKENDNAYAYISIVAIVAIVALFVMFAGSGSKETSQPIVFKGTDLVGDARKIIQINSIEKDINDGFLKEESNSNELFWDENRINVYSEGKLLFLEDKYTGEVRTRSCDCPSSCSGWETCFWAIDGSGTCKGRCGLFGDCDQRHCSSGEESNNLIILR